MALSSFRLSVRVPRVAGFATRIEPWRKPLSQSDDQPEDYFGCNVFDQRAMKHHVSHSIQDSFYGSVELQEPVSAATADSLAKSMLQWAVERGATHFCHWFQPLTGATAEKHDTFLDCDHNGIPVSRFRGKDLIMAEPDGSSFPTGGLRKTHTARGYTVWDVNSPPFVLRHGNGGTLYIPSVFFSWESNRVLDDKTPLLRSDVALSRETKRLFEILGDKHKHTKFFTDSGLEQEYFLIARDYFLKRLDLQITGRTLQGIVPPRGQQLEDQYFGHVSDLVLDAIHDFEVEMWKLGVPIQTRHREVAPGQYETAAKFGRSSVATDRNLLIMELLRKVAHRHGLAALLHEKPFDGVNGSGKHNNWSFGTNSVPSLLEPGPTPQKNLYFMLFLAATIRAVDLHADLMRIAISGASNDHRLGANEAPPAIVSVYLGDEVDWVVRKFMAKSDEKREIELKIDLGVPSLPIILRQATDRNRTSTFAFTGNKFEFRAVGSSQNPSRSNMTLNTIMAESIRDAATEIDKALKSGHSKEQAMEEVARKYLVQHQRVIFNGNGYSDEWRRQAEKLGLPNLKTTPQALAEYTKPKNEKLFEAHGVLNKHELKARRHVFEEEYFKKVLIEAKTLVTMARTQILPASVAFSSSLARLSGGGKHGAGAFDSLTKTIDSAYGELAGLEHEIEHSHSEQYHGLEQTATAAGFAERNILPRLASLRVELDKLETQVDTAHWPLPTYHHMLFHQD